MGVVGHRGVGGGVSKTKLLGDGSDYMFHIHEESNFQAFMQANLYSCKMKNKNSKTKLLGDGSDYMFHIHEESNFQAFMQENIYSCKMKMTYHVTCYVNCIVMHESHHAAQVAL